MCNGVPFRQAHFMKSKYFVIGTVTSVTLVIGGMVLSDRKIPIAYESNKPIEHTIGERVYSWLYRINAGRIRYSMVRNDDARPAYMLPTNATSGSNRSAGTMPPMKLPSIASHEYHISASPTPAPQYAGNSTFAGYTGASSAVYRTSNATVHSYGGGSQAGAGSSSTRHSSGGGGAVAFSVSAPTYSAPMLALNSTKAQAEEQYEQLENNLLLTSAVAELQGDAPKRIGRRKSDFGPGFPEDDNQDNGSPVGEPWIMAVFAAIAAAFTYIKKKRKRA